MFVDFFTQHSNLFNVYINFLVQNSGGGEHEVPFSVSAFRFEGSQMMKSHTIKF